MVRWNEPISVDRRVVLGVGLTLTLALAAYVWLPRSHSVPPPAPAPPAPVVVAAAPKEVKSAPPRLPPSPEEIAGLRSTDRLVQRRASQVLLTRTMTPELIEATRAATPSSPFGLPYLQCLKGRIPGPEGLEAALQLPRNIEWLAGDDAEEALCRLEILEERMAEDPVRIRDTVARYATGMSDRVRPRAIDVLKKAPPGGLPPSLREAIFQRGDFEARNGLDAAFALDPLQNFPELFDELLQMTYDPPLRRQAVSYLSRVPDHRAAQILAQALVKTPNDEALVKGIQARQASHGDQALAFVELALDERAHSDHRVVALEQLADTLDPKLAEKLTPLTQAEDPTLRTYATAAIAQLKRN